MSAILRPSAYRSMRRGRSSTRSNRTSRVRKPLQKALGTFGHGLRWTPIRSLLLDTSLAVATANAPNGLSRIAKRLANRVQLTSDGHKAYLEAVEGAFGADIDYAQLVKIYGASSESAKGRYSPAECIGVTKQRIEG